MPTQSKWEELETLRARVRELEAELSGTGASPAWHVSRDYPTYYAAGGFLLGLLGAVVSLLFNVIGSLVAGKDPLELIRVYLTFPLGEKALRLAGDGAATYAVGDGLIIALGCCLYLGTGMLLGIPISMAIARWAPRGGVGRRLAIGAGAALAVWALNFYGILSWLQPALFGGRWITDNVHLPWWVAAATHAVFGVAVAALYPMIEDVPAPAPKLESPATT